MELFILFVSVLSFGWILLKGLWTVQRFIQVKQNAQGAFLCWFAPLADHVFWTYLGLFVVDFFISSIIATLCTVVVKGRMSAPVAGILSVWISIAIWMEVRKSTDIT